jgi:ribosomal protein S18 acetylase RimI-like enzyme
LSELTGRSVSLRSIHDGDEEFLYGVYASTRQEELAQTGWSEAQKETFLRQQFEAQSTYYREHYQEASFDVILAYCRPIGRLYVARWPEEIRIVDIALLPEYRNAGIGTTLLSDLISESEACAKPLSIHVERFNPALRLYRRLGFREVADKGVYLLMERASETS